MLLGNSDSGRWWQSDATAMKAVKQYGTMHYATIRLLSDNLIVLQLRLLKGRITVHLCKDQKLQNKSRVLIPCENIGKLIVVLLQNTSSIYRQL